MWISAAVITWPLSQYYVFTAVAGVESFWPYHYGRVDPILRGCNARAAATVALGIFASDEISQSKDTHTHTQTGTMTL